MSDDAGLDAYGLTLLASAARGRVAIDSALLSDFDQLEEKAKSQFLRIMDLWIEARALTPQQFNGNEGRAKRGSANILLGAFKRFKIRLYGFSHNLSGRRTFIIIDLDPAKKQDKADPKVLKRAKERALDLVEKIES